MTDKVLVMLHLRVARQGRGNQSLTVREKQNIIKAWILTSKLRCYKTNRYRLHCGF